MHNQAQPVESSTVSDSYWLLSPRFNVGDRVYWFRVPTQDFGVVVERFYGTEGSVQALGWHYTIQLDPNSPSFAHCKTDDGFEADLALMEQERRGTDAAD